MKAPALLLPLLIGPWLSAAARDLTVEAAGPFAVEVELEALVVPGEAVAYAVGPLSAAPWSVEQIVAHGSRVKKGETILRVETRELDVELGKQRVDAKMRELALAKATKELAAMELEVRADLAAAQRKAARAKEDLEYFSKVGREATRANAAQSVIAFEQRLAATQEELTQLEAMYKADDVTEDTEEIILKRQRDDLSNAQFALAQAKLKAKEVFDTVLPRQDEDYKEAVLRGDFQLAEANENLPRALEMKRHELAKARDAAAEADRQLANLEADRKAMSFTAPVDGVLYYGEFANGSWNGAEMVKGLVRGAKLPPHRVFATLVPNASKPRLAVRLTEEQIGSLSAKSTGTAALAAQPNIVFGVAARTLSAYPDGDGRYLLELDPQVPEGLQAVAAMKAKVVMQAYQTEKALLLPKEAITRDGAGVAHVALRLANGSVEKRVVRVGHEHKGHLEILSGLEAGQVVVIGSEEKPS
jgi:HlyD family secretion protein